MSDYQERAYRRKVHAADMTSFRVAVKETDMWVSADRGLEKETLNLVFECRAQLETYIQNHPEFKTSLSPFAEDPYAPSLIKEMIDATRGIGVGPMASVAGAIAQYVGMGLLPFTEQVIVENGGDVFVKANRQVTVSILAGDSRLSEKFGLKIHESQMPLGVCASSGSVGHSLSLGVADAVCLVSSSAALADGAATALGNRIKEKRDLENIGDWTSKMEGVLGGVVIVKDKMATWGDIELVEL
jgi:ApbE superfamily uncharacterized protein (UPF0280 family)